MDKARPDYLSYLLRLWRVGDAERPVWRASVEDPHTGERRGFANLADLFSFLEEEIIRVARGQPASNRGVKGGDPHA